MTVPQRRGEPIVVDTDEHPRPGTVAEKLAKLRGIDGADFPVTAGNASGVNDGAAALVLASEGAAARHGLTRMARVVAMAAGVEPRIMGVGPVPAVRRVLAKAGLSLDQIDLIELNEAFAAHVNPNGGAIAIGHPLGMSGARLVTTAAYQLRRAGGRTALCTMCVGIGQGIAIVLQRV